MLFARVHPKLVHTVALDNLRMPVPRTPPVPRAIHSIDKA